MNKIYTVIVMGRINRLIPIFIGRAYGTVLRGVEEISDY
jgi:hypothetical protein